MKLRFTKGDEVIDVRGDIAVKDDIVAAMEAKGYEFVGETQATASQDLKRSKAAMFKSLAKLLGVASLTVAPAFVGWLDSKTDAGRAQDDANVSLKATAAEKVSNDKAWESIVGKVESLEKVVREQASTIREYRDALIRFEERVATLGRRHGVQPQPQIQIQVHEPEEELGKKLGKKRPKPKDDHIIEAQRQLQLQFQDEK
jgi:hypothetical protein